MTPNFIPKSDPVGSPPALQGALSHTTNFTVAAWIKLGQTNANGSVVIEIGREVLPVLDRFLNL